MRGCIVCNAIWSCHVHSTAHAVLDEFFPYLAQIITSMRGCVAHNDLWPWPIFSRLYSCDAYLYYYIHMWHKYKPWEDNVSHTISRSKSQKWRSQGLLDFFVVGMGVSQKISDYYFWLAQLMACSLTLLRHCLNPCWLIISKVQWHSTEGNFKRNTTAINH